MIVKDSPLNNIADDKFGREPIVDLIVGSINQTVKIDHDCMVYGIYGKWGEGKTSLMNFVKARLVEQGKDNGINLVEFNPWLVNNEESLLREFFSSIIKDADETTRSLFKKYGSLAIFASKTIVNAFVPGAGDALAAGIGMAKDALVDSQDSIAELKTKVSDAIAKSKRHIVVMIDDVDRLDKEELHTVFRLIRQVADFKNCIYIVAMDVDMVAKAIGYHYGDGSHQDGRKFIDKIVQVPITLPQIPQCNMLDFVRMEMSVVLKDATDVEQVAVISKTVLPFINTYRDLKRYCNQISFILPHLAGEVNIHDLCALEAIKMVNATAYRRIYEKEEALRHIVGSTALLAEDKGREEAAKNYEKAKEWVCEGMTGRLRDAVKDTLDFLFNTGSIFGQDDIDKKRLDTGVYFQKYFTQLVPGDLIPDRVLDEFGGKIGDLSVEDVAKQLDEWLERYSSSEVKRASLYFIRKNKDRNELCRVASMMAKALSICKLANGLPPRVYVDANAITAFVVIQIIYGCMFVQDEKFAQMNVWDETLLNDTLAFIFEKAEMNYCMGLLGSADGSIFGGGVYNGRKVFPVLIGRFTSMGFEEQFKFSKFLLFTFLNRWRRVATDSFNEYAKDLFVNPEHDMGTILNKFIDGRDDGQDVANFVGLFQLQIPQINERLQGENEDVRTSHAARIYASNYRPLIGQ